MRKKKTGIKIEISKNINSKKKNLSSRKFSKKKSVSHSTQNALKRIEMQKKNYPYDRLRAERRSAKPERRIGLVFWEDRRWDRT